MEIRTLRSFLAVAREESISAASESLYISQPALSRQMMELEQELETRLFYRGGRGRKLQLTEEGQILKKRAEEILLLLERTNDEIKKSTESLSGELHIGAAEVPAFSILARTCQEFLKNYPLVHISFHSANADDVLEKMEYGLYDFGLLIRPSSPDGYEYLRLPVSCQWGILINSESPLAKKDFVTPDDLVKLPLIISSQSQAGKAFHGWLKRDLESLNIVCRYNLLYNAAFLAAQNLGAVLTLDGLQPEILAEQTKFIPLNPPLHEDIIFVWRSSHELSKQASVFLEYFQNAVSGR